MLVVLLIALAWILPHAEPILHDRVVHALSARFKSPVELDQIHISLAHGFRVEGGGLRILYLAGPSLPDVRQKPPPMLNIRSFQFQASLRELLSPTLRLVSARVQGAELRIPPPGGRNLFPHDDRAHTGQPAEGLFIDRIIIDDLKIVIENKITGKPPLAFDVSNLTLTDVGLKKPFNYEATLRNPKPVGDVHSTGHFGPWQSDNPRDTPLDGGYSFTHVDLGSIKGLSGTLSSTGNFHGTLGGILIDGSADTPDLRLTVSGHPLPLHADFHAIVDATTGDTYLQPVNALLQHSRVVASGSITRKTGVPGHDIELDVEVGPGRIDDMLTLAGKTYPPALRGALTARCRLSIPPGPDRVTQRMRLNGSFTVSQGVFTNTRLQQQINGISERARARPEYANAQMAEAVTSSMKGSFNLANEQMQISGMTYQMPGATVLADGQYGLDCKTLDFHGTVRTQATASEMVGGWKQLLVMPFDRFLKKNGAGVELPFKVGGTQADPKLDLDFGHKAKPSPAR